MKNTEPNEAGKASNFESTSDGKNEDFLRFEHTLKGLLSIPPDEVKEIVKRTPYPKDGETESS